LLQREGSTSWAAPLAAPVVHMLFRPEQEHGTSREDDVLIPVAGGHRDMDHAFLLQKPSILYGKWHLEVTAGATCVDGRIFVQHGGDAERVPDAVAPPGAFANAHRKRGRDRRERCGAPELAIVLQHEGVALAKTDERFAHLLPCGCKRLSYFRNGGYAARPNGLPIHKEAHAGIEIMVVCDSLLGAAHAGIPVALRRRKLSQNFFAKPLRFAEEFLVFDKQPIQLQRTIRR
jgi:hypothetical protein